MILKTGAEKVMDKGSKTLGTLSDEGLEFRVSSLGFRS